MSNKYEELFQFIKNNKWNKLKDKLNYYHKNINKEFFDPNIKDENNNYLITYSILFNKIDILEILIKLEANIDIKDNDNKSILYIPIYYGYNNIVEFLIKVNKNNIGISILDIKDNKNRCAIHYAIELKNIYALNLILQNNSNPNIIDEYGYNSLHLSIYTRNLEIISIIIGKIYNINSISNTGETALHIASNLQLIDACELLIRNKIDTNIQDFEHEFNALHYSSSLGNLNITDLLLKNNCNPNLQDVFGNTSIHYSIIQNNFSCFLHIIEMENNYNYKINYNLWNIDGKIPLHLLLELYDSNREIYFKKLINFSDLNIQDNNGNSCLILIFKNNLWEKYFDILKNKNINFFLKNNKNKFVFDYVDDNKKKMLTDKIVDYYINHYNKNNTEIISQYSFLNETNLKTIEKNIKHIINSTKNQDFNICKYIFYENFCMKNDFNITNDIKFTTYTGSTLDVLIGLVYLLKKYNKSCSTLYENNFNFNSQLLNYYQSIGYTNDMKNHFLNFEISWIDFKLFFPENFKIELKNCLKKNIRFIIFPLGIEIKNASHANYLIYDKKINEIERFEPNGSSNPIGINYNYNLLDEMLEKKFNQYDMIYISPKKFLPKISFQSIDAYDKKNRKIGDPSGFCALWSMWYTDNRLFYSDINRKDLVNLLLIKFKMNNISFKNLIRNYSKYVINIRDNLLLKNDMEINDWINLKFSDKQLKNFINSIKIYIKN